MKPTHGVIALLILALLAAPVAMAKKKAKKKESGDVVHLGGMSVIGNRELPKSLYIVPWKESQLDKENDLSRGLLDERLKAVDPEEFRRELNYYEQSR